MIKIIYIAGDGRSGSTLLEGVLSNITESISVGECHRFWNRYYQKDTVCGCSEPIEQCNLWSRVDAQLKEQNSTYDAQVMLQKVREIQQYRNFKRIPQLLDSPSWREFGDIVKSYYLSIASLTNSKIIIDSSKSIPWAYVLQHLDFADLHIIHLERNLSSVANSWKKQLVLPEYTSKEVFMPRKSNGVVLKSWIKVKWLARYLHKKARMEHYQYEMLCRYPEDYLKRISVFIDETIPLKNLGFQYNHAIGGNPIRFKVDKKIVIRNSENSHENLRGWEKVFFGLSNKLSKIFIK